MGASAKAQTHVETCHPGESPRLGVAEAPPFRKGGFGALPRFPPGNVTGHWRGSNDLQKTSVRIVSGDSPRRPDFGIPFFRLLW